MNRKTRRVVAALFLLLCLLALWLFGPDRKVARAKALRDELFSAAGKQLAPEQRKQRWDEYRTLTKGMTPAQRDSLSAEGRKRRQQEIGRYFRLSPRERTAYLDAQIRREQQMQQKMQARGGPPGKGRGPGGNSAASSKRSEQERDQSRQGRLDSSSPAERAQMAQFRKELATRRQQLGIRR